MLKLGFECGLLATMGTEIDSVGSAISIFCYLSFSCIYWGHSIEKFPLLERSMYSLYTCSYIVAAASGKSNEVQGQAYLHRCKPLWSLSGLCITIVA